MVAVCVTSGAYESGSGSSCDVCNIPLDETETVYAHPYETQAQQICSRCVSASDVLCCAACEKKVSFEALDQGLLLANSYGVICALCCGSAPINDYRIAHRYRIWLSEFLRDFLGLPASTHTSLAKIPVRLSSTINVPSTALRSSRLPCTKADFSCLSSGWPIPLGCCAYKFGAVTEIRVLKNLPSITFCYVLAHELFHAALSLDVKAATAKTRVAKRLHGLTDASDAKLEYRILEEAAGHLLASNTVKNLPPLRQHDKLLRTVWTAKGLDEAMKISVSLDGQTLSCIDIFTSAVAEISGRYENDQINARRVAWHKFYQELLVLKFRHDR